MEVRKDDNVCEESQFKELFRIYSKDLHDYLYYRFGRDNNPKDVVQEAFLKLWDNCHKVTRAKAKSFLFTVATNKMINELAKKKTVLSYTQQKPKTYTHESPDYVLEEKEYMDKLQQAIQNLSEDQRVAFMLNRIEGKRHKEIAEMLGVSRKTVEKRIYTALDKLRKQVEGL